MRKISEIKELPVLSIQDGVNVEKVCRVAVNPATRKAEFVSFAGAPWYEPQMVMPWSKLNSIGRDLITIKSRKDISQVNDELRKSLARTSEIVGQDVIDSSGRVMGRVADLAIDEASGEVRKIMLTDGIAVDISSVVTIGPSAVIVEAGAEAQQSPAFSESEFLLGKTVSADVSDEQGNIIIKAGTVISMKEIDAAKAGNALYDLVTGVK